MLRLVEKAELSVPRRAVEDEHERNNTIANATAAVWYKFLGEIADDAAADDDILVIVVDC